MPKPQMWATDVLNEMSSMSNNVAQVTVIQFLSFQIKEKARQDNMISFLYGKKFFIKLTLSKHNTL